MGIAFMGIDYNITASVMQNASIYLASQAQLELTAKRRRTAIRASWKKIGDGWKVAESQKKTFRGNYVATGNLVKSIRPFSEGLEFGMTALWYAEAIRAGRQPWANSKFKGNKGVPFKDPNVILEWANVKRLRPRDTKTGQFIPNTQRNRKAMAFLMNRKIKYFGIEPFDFKSIAQRTTMAKFKPEIDMAIKKDQQNYLKIKRTEK